MFHSEEGTPLRTLELNKVFSVPQNEPLLHILDKFQEGRSHIALVSRLSKEKALSVKKEVKQGLTHRLKARVGMADSDASSSGESDSSLNSESEAEDPTTIGDGASGEGKKKRKRRWGRSKKSSKKKSGDDLEKGEGAGKDGTGEEKKQDTSEEPPKSEVTPATWSTKVLGVGREQSMPDDAVLSKDGARDVWSTFLFHIPV